MQCMHNFGLVWLDWYLSQMGTWLILAWISLLVVLAKLLQEVGQGGMALATYRSVFALFQNSLPVQPRCVILYDVS